MVSLSAAVVVKDEADRLDACLTSLRGLVDEIVVVDTGSSDHTVAIAEQHGAVVAHEIWQGDFAASRNRSLDLATGDWILSVDADDEVSGDFDDARAYLDRAVACVGCRVRFVPRVGWTPSREYRLWRNRPDIRFQGRILETVVPSIRAAADAYALQIEPFDRITIRHFGDEGGRAEHACAPRAVAHRRDGPPSRSAVGVRPPGARLPICGRRRTRGEDLEGRDHVRPRA